MIELTCVNQKMTIERYEEENGKNFILIKQKNLLSLADQIRENSGITSERNLIPVGLVIFKVISKTCTRVIVAQASYLKKLSMSTIMKMVC
jgi:hypothetical protein